MNINLLDLKLYFFDWPNWDIIIAKPFYSLLQFILAIVDGMYEVFLYLTGAKSFGDGSNIMTGVLEDERIKVLFILFVCIATFVLITGIITSLAKAQLYKDSAKETKRLLQVP